MIGFSGGDHFVHRFLNIHPNLLNAVSIGAPGRVTRLDDQRKWPAGVKDVSDRFDGAVVDFEMIRQLPVQLISGALDTETHGSEEFWQWLEGMKKQEKDIKHQSSVEDRPSKTTTRMETLKRIKEDWQTNNIRCQLDIVDGAGHEHDKVVEAVVEFLRPYIRVATQELEHGE
jgi:hypothetical protein